MTGMTDATSAAAWLPQDYGDLLDTVVQEKSIASKAATLFTTTRQTVRFPLWTADPAVGWYSELDTIAIADGSTNEVVVTPSKTAGIDLLSNELVGDSDPAIALQVAQGLANQIAGALDTAFFGNTTAKGPNGLQSLTTAVVDPGASITNLDAFVAARYAAEAHAANLTHWLLPPAVAQTLSQLKIGSGYNQSLLQFVDDGVQIAGIPALTSTHVVGTGISAWGVDASQIRFVQRQGTTVELFDSPQNDAKWVRAVSRVGFGFLNPAGIVALKHSS